MNDDARRVSVSRERDLVLPPNTHAFILNKQKGDVDVYVGPHKSNLDDNTDQPVIFDYKEKKFVSVQLSEAIKNNVIAPEGWYIVLKNPATDNAHPAPGTGTRGTLQIGKKINIPGPSEFPLFPGQMCKVIQGHHLRSNQYLIARVYDPEVLNKKNDEEFTMGQLMVIKGTERAFYIPPTGVEVVAYKNEAGGIAFVQNAVSLEQLEYCILLDEDGNKQYVKGPDVVFPKPTQQFIMKNGLRKYKAINLNDISGLYIKVIAPYEENGRDYIPGEELFITGRDSSIYYPREEHAIIKYDGNEVHYATAIPAGEGRYLMNRLDGVIILAKGPQMLLPDPRTNVLIRRILTPATVSKWFPGNKEALEYNSTLISAEKDSDSGEDFLSETMYRTMVANHPVKGPMFSSSTREKATKSIGGDFINKHNEYTKPRTITLNQKFEGAVRISVWRGYAILVESKSSDMPNRVIVGPKTVLLNYDEDIVCMTLSTNKPKNPTVPLITPYLRYLNNTVSDLVVAQTKDMIDVEIGLSYKVDFTGDPEKWFNVENYVQHLCDRMRSMIRRLVKNSGVEIFNFTYVDMLRDLILGKQIVAEDDCDVPQNVGSRPGYVFPENGMRITDVEVLGLTIGDEEISHQLHSAQLESVEQTLLLAKKQKLLEVTAATEDYERSILEQKSLTEQKKITIKITEKEKNKDLAITAAQCQVKEEEVKLELQRKLQGLLNEINEANIERANLTNDQKVRHAQIMSDVSVKQAQDIAKSEIEKFSAITPQLIAAIKANGDKTLLSELSKNFNIQSMVGAKSIIEAASLVIKGTALENSIDFKDMFGKTGTGE